MFKIASDMCGPDEVYVWSGGPFLLSHQKASINSPHLESRTNRKERKIFFSIGYKTEIFFIFCKWYSSLISGCGREEEEEENRFSLIRFHGCHLYSFLRLPSVRKADQLTCVQRERERERETQKKREKDLD